MRNRRSNFRHALGVAPQLHGATPLRSGRQVSLSTNFVRPNVSLSIETAAFGKLTIVDERAKFGIRRSDESPALLDAKESRLIDFMALTGHGLITFSAACRFTTNCVAECGMTS